MPGRPNRLTHACGKDAEDAAMPFEILPISPSLVFARRDYHNYWTSFWGADHHPAISQYESTAWRKLLIVNERITRRERCSGVVGSSCPEMPPV